MKSVLWRVAKRLSYIKDARCLKINLQSVSVQGRPSGLPKLIYCARDSEIFYEQNLVICLFLCLSHLFIP